MWVINIYTFFACLWCQHSWHLDQILDSGPFSFFREATYGTYLPVAKLRHLPHWRSYPWVLPVAQSFIPTIIPFTIFKTSSFLLPFGSRFSATPGLHWKWFCLLTEASGSLVRKNSIPGSILSTQERCISLVQLMNVCWSWFDSLGISHSVGTSSAAGATLGPISPPLTVFPENVANWNPRESEPALKECNVRTSVHEQCSEYLVEYPGPLHGRYTHPPPGKTHRRHFPQRNALSQTEATAPSGPLHPTLWG